MVPYHKVAFSSVSEKGHLNCILGFVSVLLIGRISYDFALLISE